MYLRNRLPTSALKDKSPYEKWHGCKPDLSGFKVFGCTAYAHIVDTNRKKFDCKAQKLRFVGYSLQSKGYRLYCEEAKKIYVRCDVIFNETDFNYYDKRNSIEQLIENDHEVLVSIEPVREGELQVSNSSISSQTASSNSVE